MAWNGNNIRIILHDFRQRSDNGVQSGVIKTFVITKMWRTTNVESPTAKAKGKPVFT